MITFPSRGWPRERAPRAIADPGKAAAARSVDRIRVSPGTWVPAKPPMPTLPGTVKLEVRHGNPG